jgi:predicted flavoprotein YhiN
MACRARQCLISLVQSLRYWPNNPISRWTLSLICCRKCPFHDLTTWLSERREIDPKLEMADYLTGLLNKKLGQAILKRYLDQRLTLAAPVARLTDRDLPEIASLLKSLSIRAVGTRDWTQAQVTAGGLATGDFRPETLESRHSEGPLRCRRNLGY